MHRPGDEFQKLERTHQPGADGPVDDRPIDGWVCPDGMQAPAHYSYVLDPANLTGVLTYTKAPLACGNPDMPTDTDGIRLAPIRLTDSN